MASGKEITTKIKSVENTRKVTSALEMVSASKIRKSQDLMNASRPYKEMIRRMVSHLSKANPEYRHPFTVRREEVKKVGYIVVSTDRGLCGGLNTNLFKLIINNVQEWKGKGADISLVTLGKKASSFFRNIKVEIAAHAAELGEKPQIEDLIGSIKVMLDAYREGSVDMVYSVYNDFVNTMTQEPTVSQLRPGKAEVLDGYEHHWDYIYEPEAKPVLDALLTRFIEAQVYQGVVENIACEQSARMVSMKAASDNAGDMIDDLELVYNKARQAAITQELSEIVSGAAALD